MADAKASAIFQFAIRLSVFHEPRGGGASHSRWSPDMKRCGVHKLVAPCLIAKDAEAQFRITVLGTRFNCSNYPIVSSKLQPEIFKSAMAARAYGKLEFGTLAGPCPSEWRRLRRRA
jgi:hypothetical protein